MSRNGDAARVVARNLHDAIERVREDVAKVEFWADAVAGFTQPVPDYDASDAKIWIPPEQATTLEAGPGQGGRKAGARGPRARQHKRKS